MVARPLHGMNAAGDPFSTDGRAVAANEKSSSGHGAPCCRQQERVLESDAPVSPIGERSS
jgi:hypothetical protein